MSDLKTILDTIESKNADITNLIAQARVFQPVQTTDAITTVTNNYLSFVKADTIESAATLQFVKDPLYFNLIALYLFVGGNKAINALDPEDSDEAYRLTGKFSNDSKGISMKAGDVVDTHISPYDLCGIAAANIGVGYYIQNPVTKLIEAPDPKNYFRFINSDRFYINIGIDTNGIPSPKLNKHVYAQRNNSIHELFNNGQKIGAESRVLPELSSAYYLPKETIKIIPTEDVVISCLYFCHSTANFDNSIQLAMKNLSR